VCGVEHGRQALHWRGARWRAFEAARFGNGPGDLRAPDPRLADDVVFCLETKNSVMGKIVLRRDEIALLPEPE
jgi:hypothetical protein